ncbi:probable di-heme cytochrome c [Aromatoleum aromaticum EbN1]|uniref:Probable di-heme cytochrome c n=1 Tax=Aromatoleum aromaticum (strain DSM 19018 / LMG 30748 / EbN1) TaxID=76114 RepID=Q5P7Q8_AROAE|nr:ethylbenzene dehydrogenase-related protein [Aromatoleum aromaticum]CAI06653.1 probable di-heme cytochrome c [Aromatoleum aromaticum EbN1]
MNKSALILSCAVLVAGAASAADPATIDWSKIPAVKVPLFYPGQSSYEWLRSADHKKAQKETIEGQACISCHKNEEKALGEKLVKGGDLEPMPVKGKNGFLELSVQAAYDAKNAYFRYQWKTNGKAGIEYPYYRFDGKAWKVHGGPRLDQAVQDGQQPAIYEDRLSMMVDDGKVPMFAQQGCWLSCHEGERDLNAATKEEAADNGLLKAIKKTDVRKYLPASRSDPQDWTTGKSPDEIARIKTAGGFVDLIQWRAHRTNPVSMADDGYVLEYRNFDAGKNAFASNMDGTTKQPKFMFDTAKFGARAVAVADLGKKDHFLIKGANAVPFDPNAGWKEGDLLPRYVLSAAEAAGSGADNKASGSWNNGVWTVVLVRPLNLANDDDKAFAEGKVYNVGFAVHDDNITTRGHQVSFVRTVGIGTKADIQAVKLP